MGVNGVTGDGKRTNGGGGGGGAHIPMTAISISRLWMILRKRIKFHHYFDTFYTFMYSESSAPHCEWPTKLSDMAGGHP